MSANVTYMLFTFNHGLLIGLSTKIGDAGIAHCTVCSEKSKLRQNSLSYASLMSNKTTLEWDLGS